MRLPLESIRQYSQSTIRKRVVQSFLASGVLFEVAIVGTIVIGGAIYIQAMKTKSRDLESLLVAVSVITVVVGAFISIAVLMPLFAHEWPRFPAGVTSYLMSPWVFFWSVCTGVGLYRIRGSAPLVYGLLEVLVALLSLAFASIVRHPDLIQWAVPFVAGTYFLIRGLDNIDRALPSSLRDRWEVIFPKR